MVMNSKVGSRLLPRSRLYNWRRSWTGPARPRSDGCLTGVVELESPDFALALLRALGIIYFSAFFSLVFQIRGLVGPPGILPAVSYLQTVSQSLGHWQRLWYAPTLLWLSSSSVLLIALCWAGMITSLLLVLNVWPIVENAVRHGLGQSEEAVMIEVGTSSANGSLTLVVSDDGPGLLSSKPGASGIGLTNTKTRLARRYGDRARLLVEQVAGRGVRVTITLPMRTVQPDGEPCN
jgi:hypothetical protein